MRRAYAWDSEAAPVPRGYDPPVTAPTVTVPADVLARYPGRYVGDENVTVRLDNSVLQANVGGGWIPLVALSETEFLLFGNTRVRFVIDAAGAVTGLTVRISGRDVLLQRR